MGFYEKVALITGGTAGIGEATVRLVASLGARVVFVGRDRLKGERLERELRSRGNDVTFFQADLRIPQEARETVPFVVRKYGRLDYALNNAGTSGEIRLLTEQTEEDFDEVFSVNVKGLFLTVQAELQQMVRQGAGGSIVNMASVGGMLAAPGASPYIASKHAVIGLTKSAAVEYGPHGIRVNAVSPGAIRTEMLREVFGSDEALRQAAKAHPLGRIGTPEEVADAVAWLFSDSSSYYTGQVLTLDGGLTAQRPSARLGVLPSETARDEEESPVAI
jgi:A-factor type gamma-butyrolactone 1'-reductase (1S-forming)